MRRQKGESVQKLLLQPGSSGAHSAELYCSSNRLGPPRSPIKPFETVTGARLHTRFRGNRGNSHGYAKDGIKEEMVIENSKER